MAVANGRPMRTARGCEPHADANRTRFVDIRVPSSQRGMMPTDRNADQRGGIEAVDQTSRTWLLTGIPRSGSSLCCRLAGKLSGVVGLSEPINRDLSSSATDAETACGLIERFVESTRARAIAEGIVPTVHVHGQLDDDRVEGEAGDDGLRRRRGEQGEIALATALAPDFGLLIKHNALFAALLPHLAPRFDCLAIVRNPLAILASWQTVDLPVARGRIPAGEQFDPGLRASLDAEPDLLRRQVGILNWFFQQYDAYLDARKVIRYEDLIATGGRVLYQALGDAQAPPEALASRNDNVAYDAVDVGRLLQALLERGGAWSGFYAASELAAVAEAMPARR